jgi:Resolvase, N terminal domain
LETPRRGVSHSKPGLESWRYAASFSVQKRPLGECSVERVEEELVADGEIDHVKLGGAEVLLAAEITNEIGSILAERSTKRTAAVDTSTPMGRAMFHIAGAFAELEREIIRERVKAGLQNARRRGKRLGRRRAMVNVQAVDEMASGGLSGRAIAKTVGVSEATVRRILRSSRDSSAAMVADAACAPVP